MKEIQFNLTVDETNVILSALGELPYKQVSGLIAKLHAQANKQLQATTDAEKLPPDIPVKENGEKSP